MPAAATTAGHEREASVNARPPGRARDESMADAPSAAAEEHARGPGRGPRFRVQIDEVALAGGRREVAPQASSRGQVDGGSLAGEDAVRSDPRAGEDARSAGSGARAGEDVGASGSRGREDAAGFGSRASEDAAGFGSRASEDAAGFGSSEEAEVGSLGREDAAARFDARGGGDGGLDRSGGRVEARAADGADALVSLGEAAARGEEEGATLLARLRRERFSGCVQAIADGGPARRLWWSEGQVIGGASASAAESVLGRLSARGLLDAGHLELVHRWSTGDPRRDVERLAQAGWIKPQEAQEALREPVRRIVERIAESGAVVWALHPGARPTVAVELGVPLAALIAGGVRGGASRGSLHAAVPDELRPRLAFAGPEALAAELRWPGAAAIAGRFDGRTSVGALVAAAVADEDEIRGLVRVLGLLGHLAPPVEDAEASLVALDRRRVRERLRLARETDYFALLGLPREATRAEVLRAHADLSATFGEALEPASRVELAEELEELRAALDEAREVLTDEALHSAYLAQLGEP